MATYKVAQDVEAEDKILGPFSLKQVIFIMLFFGAGWMGFLFSRITPPLAVVMLPFLIVFGVLGFVQRKDQPVEVYLAALMRFYLKPHKRKWDQEGYDQRVIITAPKVQETKRVRDITLDQAESQLSELAKLMDSRGWAAKGLVTTPSDRLVKLRSPRSEMEAEINTDIMDEQDKVSQKFDELIHEQASEQRLAAIERMHKMQAAAAQQLNNAAATSAAPATSTNTAMPSAHFDPYPTDMHQTVISPYGASAPKPAQNQTPPAQPIAKPVPPAIIRLANNNDLTVSALAREAHSLPSEEVVISLR
jgi:hypothetical protein